MHSSAPYNPRLVGWLSLAQLISWGSVFYLFALVMGPIERELGLSRVQSSLAFSLCLLADGLLAYPVGRLIDRGHERAVMTAGSLLLALGLLLHAFVSSLAGFYAVWVLLGVGMSGTLYPPVFAVVTRRFPTDFRRAIITMTFLGGLASTVFIPLTAWLIDGLGWRGAVMVLAAINLVVCAPLHCFWLKYAPVIDAPVKEVPVEHAPVDNAPILIAINPINSSAFIGFETALSKDGRTAASGGLAEAPSPARPTQTASREMDASPLAAHLKSAPYLLIGLAISCMTVATAALPSHMVTLLREYGLDERWVIAIPASIGVLQVFGRLLLYFFEHRMDVHLANRLIPGLMPLGLALLLLAPLLTTPKSQLMLMFLMSFVLLWGMGNGMLTIVKGTAVAQYVSREHVASLNGALGFPLALVRAAAPLGLGLMWTVEAGYRNGLLVMLVMGVAGTLALALAQRSAQRVSPDPAVKAPG
jgi:MFS family permease